MRGYVGFYLQAILGDCNYEAPCDMAGSYNHSAHEACKGLTTLEAVEWYIAVVEEYIRDPAHIRGEGEEDDDDEEE